MTTILFAPETFNLAETTRGIEVARRLPGIRCEFSGYSRRYAQHIVDAGFTFHLLDPELSERDADALLALDQGRGLRNPLTADVLRRRVASERDLIEELGADAVFIGTTLSQFISARAQGVPLIYLKPFAYSTPHLRSMTRTGMFRREGPVSRALDGLAACLVRSVNEVVRVLPPGWRTVAQDHGVELRGPTMELIDADLNLLATPREFIPRHITMPDDYRVVGPVSAQLGGEVPPEVSALRRAGSPVVYLAVGSSGGRELVWPILQSLARAPLTVLAPVRHLLSEADVRSLPEHVHVTGWLPAHLLGDVVDLAITHGGEGTLQNSIAQAWPTLGVPLQLEQRYNLLRLVEHGAAQLVEKRQVARLDWGELALRVLDSGELSAGARRLRDTVGATDGAQNAAEEVLRFLGASSPDVG